MKKVYILFDCFPPDTSGGLVATYERLVELLKNDYQFEIISTINCGKEIDERFKNVFIHNLSKHQFYPEMGLIKNGNLFEKLKHILFLLLYLLYIPIGRLKLRRFDFTNNVLICVSPASAMFVPKKTKFILEVHIAYEYFWGKLNMGTFQRLFMRMPSLTLFRTKADAEKAKNKLNADYVYNFFDDSIIDIEQANKKRKNSIIFIGRLEQQKNPYRLILCAKHLKESFSDFILDIYGTGSMKDDIVKWIEEFDLKNHVRLCGFTSNKSIYSQYSLQWLTSDFEGLGLVIIESMANEIPTISSNWGDGVFEEIENGVDGFIEESIEGIVEKTIYLFENPDKLKLMSEMAKRNFYKFGKDAAHRRWIEILNRFQKEEL